MTAEDVGVDVIHLSRNHLRQLHLHSRPHLGEIPKDAWPELFFENPLEIAEEKSTIGGGSPPSRAADEPAVTNDVATKPPAAADPCDRRAHALEAAVVAARNAAVPESELREALAGAMQCPPADRIATVARREAVRTRLGRLGELATESMPALAAELKAIAAEPLPERPADDDVWQAVCVHLLAEVGRPQLN